MGLPHPLGELHETAHAGARMALLGAAAMAALFGQLQLAWRDLESQTWWASNGRDVLLVFSVAVQALALVGMGFPLAAAILVAAQLTICDVLFEVALASRKIRGQSAGAVALAVALALVPACAPEQTFAALESFARALLG